MKSIVTLSFLLFLHLHVNAQWTQKAPTIKGNGNVMTEERSMETFSRVDVGGAIDVHIYPSTIHRVEVTTDENILEFVTTSVENGKLTIKTEANLKKFDQLMVVVYTPQFDALSVSGASDLWVKDNFQSANLTIEAKGASNINIENIRSEKITLKLSGATDLTISGSCDHMEALVSGSSDLVAHKLISKTCEVQGSGASDVSVHASQSITGSMKGSTELKYAGKPADVNVDISAAAGMEAL